MAFLEEFVKVLKRHKTSLDNHEGRIVVLEQKIKELTKQIEDLSYDPFKMPLDP